MEENPYRSPSAVTDTDELPLSSSERWFDIILWLIALAVAIATVVILYFLFSLA